MPDVANNVHSRFILNSSHNYYKTMLTSIPITTETGIRSKHRENPEKTTLWFKNLPF